MPNNFQAAAAATFAIFVTDVYIGWEIARPGKYEWIKTPLLICSLAVMKKMASVYAENQQQRSEAQRRRKSVCDTLHDNSFTSGQTLGAIALAFLSAVAFSSSQAKTTDGSEDSTVDKSGAIKAGFALLGFTAVSVIAVVVAHTIERRNQVRDPMAVGLLSVASSESAGGSPRVSPRADAEVGDVVVEVNQGYP
ncbi:MAG: hypothetical protein P1U34_07000 [Coxiellaceae bacterium]|nr:hypothetical protein [Coxiellaceae bacterium]